MSFIAPILLISIILIGVFFLFLKRKTAENYPKNQNNLDEVDLSPKSLEILGQERKEIVVEELNEVLSGVASPEINEEHGQNAQKWIELAARLMEFEDYEGANSYLVKAEQDNPSQDQKVRIEQIKNSSKRIELAS